MSGLADFLADAGRMYGGYSEAEAFAQKLRQAKLAEEAAALKLAGERRLADYESRVAAEAPDFLPGGSRAITVMTPGEDAVIPATPFDDEGNPMPQDLGTARPVQTENRMGALEFMHRAALEKGLTERAEGIQKKMSAFRDEGVLDTAQAILGGKSDDEIRDTFNRQGGVRLARVQRVPGSEAEIVGITEDGRPVRFNAESAMRSALASEPSKFFNTKNAEGELERRRSDDARRRDIEQANSTSLASLRKSQGEAAITRANAAATSAAARGAPKAVDPAKERAERRKFNADVSRYAKDEAKVLVDDKWAVDNDLASQIVGLSLLLADEDPDLLGDPRAAVQAARQKLDELRSKAVFKAGREWDAAEEGGGHDAGTFQGFTMEDGTREGKANFVKRRTEEIVKSLLKSATSRQPASASRAPRPGDVVDGWKFLGGNPKDQNNWTRP